MSEGLLNAYSYLLITEYLAMRRVLFIFWVLMAAKGYAASIKPELTDELQHKKTETRVATSINTLSHDSQYLRVLTWNVQLMTSWRVPAFFLYYFTGQNMNSPHVRAMHIASNLIEWDHDVVVLQEVTDSVLRQELNIIMYEAGYHITPVLGEEYSLQSYTYLFNGGVIIYSKRPLLNRQEIILPSCYGLQGWASMGVMYVQTEFNEKRLHLFGLHLQTIVSNKKEEYLRQRDHIDSLSAFIQNLNIPEEEIVLIIGDFNVDSGNVHLKGDESDNYKYLLEKIQAKEPGTFSQHSLPYSYNPQTNKIAVGQPGTLDHILCLKTHACPGNNTFHIFPVSCPFTEYNELSDHYPLEGILIY